MLILFFYYFLSVISGIELCVSTTVRDNKIYTICQDRELGYVKSKVYELEEGPTANITCSEKTFELGSFPKGYKLVFIDVLDNSLDSHNRLWVRADLNQSISEQQNDSYRSWVGYIKLDDMSLKTDSSIIKFPTHEKFPIFGYTTNRITNEFGSALYVTGGGLYSKKDDNYSINNSFFKYNFTTKEWIDITYSTNGKLKPMIRHKSVVIDNRYLVILGGYVEYSKDSPERLNGNKSIFEYYSLYNLTVFDTFTNSFNSVNIKPDLFDTSIATLQFNSFLATVYNDKIIVLGGYVGKDGSISMNSNSYLGILDYNSKTWTWDRIVRDDSEENYYDTLGSNLLAYNNQLVILQVNKQIQFVYTT
ncbi:hypothetical protein CONCODRAFT_2741 [Conidiobolus coronatus NRRL 28638]|uniref:Galactose oxidase n=1 Tax=Conidiobolus coronatus (strain ATCC 28846 / CBS 209.66 / NRRL 28638) TaxID=796925 RepID=A0A137PGS4_CONC2|nr:hypothetical protein CONCODRAFT_2741 [Conidiobolus coronatus NRRL 28638]|eukprot:KXN74209.1 hypothetical protein CONCODRAFT_2741 [Conidiobolus coronatus NRRL 28638]